MEKNNDSDNDLENDRSINIALLILGALLTFLVLDMLISDRFSSLLDIAWSKSPRSLNIPTILLLVLTGSMVVFPLRNLLRRKSNDDN